ncbi:hypothetical protein O181_051132 [Austropuccinia psidii MF-1]|uniref:Uncharacterized protein n=1 Tax=Austropuccinia psidii MF-1 TaxID=1389203 RepID=A0A9Q3E0B7_9BASI|nr:hypothetical protein [Austropuccinia psidii MF-1]
MSKDSSNSVTWASTHSIPGIEEGIEKWKFKLTSLQVSILFDVAQGRVWNAIISNSSTNNPLELGFGLFVDWFNPKGNKIAGEQLSMGIIVLYCLNLPPRKRFQPKFTCLAGFMPSPNQPDMITINNFMKPLVDELNQLKNGITVCTPNYPHGQKVIVKLVVLIGDIGATHKVGGLMSHSAKTFCSWREIQDNERVDLKIGKLRTQNTVLAASHQWNEARTVTLRQKYAKEHEIQWSELNRLPYWDPTTNISLGVVHNWYEEDDFGSEEGNTEMKGYLSEELIEKIRKRLNEVIVPKGVSHIPSRLGTAQTGKLKAN